MTQQIIAEPATGLGNRLRCIGSLIRIARRIGSEFSFSWPVNSDLPASFEDLYDEPLNRLRVSVSDSAGPDSSGGQDKRILCFQRGRNRRVLTANHLQYPTIRARAAYLYLLETHPGKPERRALAMRETGEILSAFRLNPYLAERLDEVSRELEIERRVGVHVRRGDVPANRRVELPTYYAKIADRYADSPLFVASDDHRVLRAFQQQFGSHVAVFEARSRDRLDQHAAQDALIELMLLVRTQVIVTGVSSFTEVAAMIGRTRRELLRPE